MKIFHALGPGDIVQAHRDTISGASVKSETSVIFSGQFFEFCREHKIKALGISHNRRGDRLVDGDLQVENRPRFLEGSRGILFHISQVLRALYLAFRAKRFGADFAIVDSGSTHYFALILFPLLGIPISVNFHNSLWPSGFPYVGGVNRIVRMLDRLFFRYSATAAFGVSPECGAQLNSLTGGSTPFFEYRSQFREEGFERKARSITGDKIFRVGYISRLTKNKGAFDIVAIASLLQNVTFDVCGDGADLDEFRRLVEANGLSDKIIIHGRLKREQILEIYASIDAVIVPTRSDFAEGLPLVCAEAVISNLPIITSRLSNALDVLGPAIIEAEPNDPKSYADCILKLSSDPELYRKLVQNCPQLAMQFLDRSSGYPSALDEALCHLDRKWVPLKATEPIFARLQ